MTRAFLKSIAFIKGLVLILRPHIFFGWLRHPFQSAANILSLTKWIASQDKNGILDDFYSPTRDYTKRYQLYQHVLDTYKLNEGAFDYLEFGVSGAYSFKWWLAAAKNTDSKFYGFDTFEGLPESWGVYDKGAMSANIPVLEDTRAAFIKGLFQDSLPDFLATHNLKNDKRKIIHLDADLFSSTLYVLTSLGSYLKKGDILIFDEFNVPNHEYFAFKLFCESYYVKTKLIGAVNNYFAVAMIIE